MSQQHPYPPVQPMQVAPQPSNGIGTTGFILGLVGLIISLIPLFGVIAWPLVILGIIFSAIGLVRIKNGKADNKGLTIAGLVAAVVGLGICITWTVVAAMAVNNVRAELDRVAKVEYEVTGTATDVEVTYGEVLKPQEEKVAKLPWTKQTENKGVLKGGSLVVTIGAKGGSATCKITVDGKVVSTKTSDGAFKVLSCTGV
ncbi:MmpS family transport accessory protein [Crossiella sp. CA198]|uniref:MmpS family transport accessory protein n=1 Tax=Crossiella sp. CA198 TaxID=3455607 RepID=UPI003F8D3CA4